MPQWRRDSYTTYHALIVLSPVGPRRVPVLYFILSSTSLECCFASSEVPGLFRLALWPPTLRHVSQVLLEVMVEG